MIRICDAMPDRTGVIRIVNLGCRTRLYGARFLFVVLVSTDTSAILPQPVGLTKSIAIVPPRFSSSSAASSVISSCIGSSLRTRSRHIADATTSPSSSTVQSWNQARCPMVGGQSRVTTEFRQARAIVAEVEACALVRSETPG